MHVLLVIKTYFSQKDASGDKFSEQFESIKKEIFRQRDFRDFDCLHRFSLVIKCHLSSKSISYQLINKMSCKLKVDKPSQVIVFELLSSNQAVVVSVFEKIDNKTLVYEKAHLFQDLQSTTIEFCQNWDIFCHGLTQIAQNKPEDITLDQNGKVTVHYEVSFVGKIVPRQIYFQLDKKLQNSQELLILRTKVSSYEEDMAALKKQMTNLKVENVEINCRLNMLEQMISSQQQNGNKTQSVARKIYAEQTSEEIQKKQKKPETKQKSSAKDSKEEHIKLKLEIDPSCLHFNKYNINQNTISSLHEDYYQVCWKNPLPSKGSVSISAKMTSKNHCSVGILTESSLKNQYSFQNKNSVCMYTYFDGFFRGLYVRGDYHPLDWGMELNQVMEINVDMTEGTFVVSLNNQKSAKEVDIKQLLGERLYFFVEMYEKDNSLEFL